MFLIIIHGKQVENIKYFNYLGSLLNSDVRCTCEIKSRNAVTEVAFNKAVTEVTFNKKKTHFTSKLG
jgi:hypothetical protein